MHKVLVLYNHPANAQAFRDYYEKNHVPLAQKLPGLLSAQYTFSVQGLGADSPYFCVWEGMFESEAAMGAAVTSAEGQAVVADIPNYATGGVVILHYDV